VILENDKAIQYEEKLETQELDSDEEKSISGNMVV